MTEENPKVVVVGSSSSSSKTRVLLAIAGLSVATANEVETAATAEQDFQDCEGWGESYKDPQERPFLQQSKRDIYRSTGRPGRRR